MPAGLFFKRPVYALADWLGLKRAEAKQFGFLALTLFLCVFGLTLGRSARDSLLVYHLGVDFLPKMYIVNAIVVVITSLSYAKLLGRAHPKVLVPSIFTLLGLTLTGAWGLIQLEQQSAEPFFLGFKASVAILYVIAQVTWVLSVMQVWNLAIEIIDAQLAKRLFPMLGAAGLLAILLGGQAIGPLTHIPFIGTPGLIIVWAFLLLIAAPVSFRLIHSVGLGRKVAEKGSSEGGILNELKSNKYLKLFCSSTFFMWISVYLVEYLFMSEVSLKFDQKMNEMTRFLGYFSSAWALLALLVHLYLTPRFLKKIGVATSAAFFPSLYTVFIGLYLALGGFYIGVILRFVECTMVNSLHDSVYHLLYTPLTERMRSLARSFLEGVIKPLSIALSGGLITFAISIQAEKYLPAIALAFAFAFLWSMTRQRSSYSQTLLHLLHSGGRALKAQALEALRMSKDQSFFERLLEEAQNPDERRALAALDLYKDIGGIMRVSVFESLLVHPSGKVRARVIEWIGEDLHKEGKLSPFLEDQDEEAALAALILFGKLNDLSEETLLKLQQDQRLRLKAEAMLQSRLLEGMESAEEFVRYEFNRANSEVRGYLLNRIGEIGIRGFDEELRQGLKSDAAPENHGAVQLAIQPAYPSGIHYALELLHDPLRANQAERILEAHGEPAFSAMSPSINPNWPEHLLARWPKLMIKTGKAKGRQALIHSVTQHCPRIRYYQALALAESEGELPLSGSDLEALTHVLKRTIRDCSRHQRQLTLLKEKYRYNIAWSFLEEVISQRFYNLRAASLLILGLIYRHGSSCLLLLPKLLARDKTRAHALETLENMMGRNDDLNQVRLLFEPDKSIFQNDTSLETRPTLEILQEIASGGIPFERWVASRLEPDNLVFREAPPMINLDHYLFLQSVALFAGLKQEELYSISELTRESQFQDGDTIFKEGDDGNSLFIIMRGEVDIIVNTPEGPKSVAKLGEKQCFGDMALLDEEKRSATVKAHGSLHCLVLDKNDFQHLLAERPYLSSEIIRFLVRRLRETNKS